MTIPPKRAQPIFVGIAALGLLLVAGYGYRGVPKERPRTSGDATVTVAQAPKASFKVAYESKASFKGTAKEVVIGKEMVARVPSPAAVPVKRAGSDDRSPRISPNAGDSFDLRRREGTTR